MTDDEPQGITLEEILIEMIDAQLELVEAVAGGKKLEDADDLRGRLNDLRDVLENAMEEPEDE